MSRNNNRIISLKAPIDFAEAVDLLARKKKKRKNEILLEIAEDIYLKDLFEVRKNVKGNKRNRI